MKPITLSLLCLGVAAVLATAQTATIQGCTRYTTDSTKCRRCAKAYKLAADGSCSCAEGYVRRGPKKACLPRLQHGSCHKKCGEQYIPLETGTGYCHCDYWCNNVGDCCDSAAAKDADCRTMAPSLQKQRISSCASKANEPTAVNATATNYRPGMCWCDEACSPAGDCCASSTSSSTTQPGPSEAAPAEPAADVDAATLAASAQQHSHTGDCGIMRRREQLNIAKAAALVAVVPAGSELQAEEIMQACQAADKGPPAEPDIIPIHWTATKVCSSGGCVGGTYTVDLVWQQINFLNVVYARIGIQFTWDGIIHQATASSADEINEYNWICDLKRYGDNTAINVVTGPEHLGGALGYTYYASEFAYAGTDSCINWVHIYEKTLPEQGGRSLVDGGLADSGYVLGHEIGHVLMLHHTWYEADTFGANTQRQCEQSASQDPNNVLAHRSDGVRDTTAQSLNTTGSILRFVNCDPDTGAYTNTSALAQQSCNTAAGFPRGDSYYNNYNNMMSYGDRTCLRTFSPGQAARARCAYKCMMAGRCESSPL